LAGAGGFSLNFRRALEVVIIPPFKVDFSSPGHFRGAFFFCGSFISAGPLQSHPSLPVSICPQDQGLHLIDVGETPLLGGNLLIESTAGDPWAPLKSLQSSTQKPRLTKASISSLLTSNRVMTVFQSEDSSISEFFLVLRQPSPIPENRATPVGLP